MSDASTLYLGSGNDGEVALRLRMANRHGLIAGATGTGKTVTLQILAENFSRAGVPVFMADVKGDLAGLAKPGNPNEKVEKRVQELKLKDYTPRPCPVVFWDLYGKNGHPIRATISEMGPLLLSNLLELNDTQEGVLYACFKIADDQGLLLLDLKDLRALLSHVAENAKQFQKDYGNISATSAATIQRALLVLEQQGAENFFGEPALKLEDLMQVDFSGNGVVSVLDATQLLPKPRLYATFLLWLLAELFEQLPEVGDVDKPKLVFFFDEAHLLFDNAPKALLEKIEQVVRLIRSKGVGVYFISQNPLDIPEDVLGQLGHRVQHALRAFTPKDQKAVKSAAQTFRARNGFDVEAAITELGTGEALASVLDEKGSPTPVARILVRPPESRIGPLTDTERVEHLKRSPLTGRYDQALDRESAYELLNKRGEQAAAAAEQQVAAKPVQRGREPESIVGAMAKSAARAIGSQIGRQIVRGVLGSLLGGGTRRR
ncbi:MAG: helicase HerA-like domain-containing protein [Pseudomonadota bacterium]